MWHAELYQLDLGWRGIWSAGSNEWTPVAIAGGQRWFWDVPMTCNHPRIFGIWHFASSPNRKICLKMQFWEFFSGYIGMWWFRQYICTPKLSLMPCLHHITIPWFAVGFSLSLSRHCVQHHGGNGMSQAGRCCGHICYLEILWILLLPSWWQIQCIKNIIFANVAFEYWNVLPTALPMGHWGCQVLDQRLEAGGCTQCRVAPITTTKTLRPKRPRWFVGLAAQIVRHLAAARWPVWCSVCLSAFGCCQICRNINVSIWACNVLSSNQQWRRCQIDSCWSSCSLLLRRHPTWANLCLIFWRQRLHLMFKWCTMDELRCFPFAKCTFDRFVWCCQVKFLPWLCVPGSTAWRIAARTQKVQPLFSCPSCPTICMSTLLIYVLAVPARL